MFIIWHMKRSATSARTLFNRTEMLKISCPTPRFGMRPDSRLWCHISCQDLCIRIPPSHVQLILKPDEMKELDADIPIGGALASTTSSGTSSALNVDDSAAPNVSDERYGFPKEQGKLLSYWLQGVRCDPLLDHRTTTELPRIADIVIIGSGVC